LVVYVFRRQSIEVTSRYTYHAEEPVLIRFLLEGEHFVEKHCLFPFALVFV
jgi:hypothetical protein